MNQLHLQRTNTLAGNVRWLPASKSLSNRALIINALSGWKGNLANLSAANDTRLMEKLLHATDPVVNAEDAGTTMRFLTAYYATQNESRTLTGTARMQERPIGILVNALQQLGASISYLGKEGYPPHQTNGFHQLTDTISIRGDVSSQYISALMMIGPTLPNGLRLHLEGTIGSKPYISMTIELMRHFGAAATWSGREIVIESKPYESATYEVESDWSAASYWYSFAALAPEANLELPGLHDSSWQGDSAIREIMKGLGVTDVRSNQQLKLVKGKANHHVIQDFTDCPDLAQTVAVVCAAKGIKGEFTGLESLRIKETDRILALQTELGKIGAQLLEQNNTWTLIPSESLPAKVVIDTYHDHRMAMAFAPLATQMDVTIHAPEVVRKSYPDFWKDVSACGVPVTTS